MTYVYDIDQGAVGSAGICTGVQIKPRLKAIISQRDHRTLEFNFRVGV